MSSPQEKLLVRFELDEAYHVLLCTFLTDQIDSLVCPEIGNQIDRHIASLDPPDKYRIVFDLAQVKFACSSFLGICVTCHRATRGRLGLVNVNPMVRKSFIITGLEHMLEQGSSQGGGPANS